MSSPKIKEARNKADSTSNTLPTTIRNNLEVITCIYYRFFEESSNNQISNSKKTMFEIIYEAVRWTRDLFNIFEVFCWPKLPNPWRKPAMWQLWQLSWHAKNLSPQKEELPIKYVFGLRFLNELIHLKRHSKKNFFLPVGIYNLKFWKDEPLPVFFGPEHKVNNETMSACNLESTGAKKAS